jgi:hypothetical protein
MKRIGLMIGFLGFLFFAQSAQADWLPAKRLTWSLGDSQWPEVAVDPSGNLHRVWYDKTPGNEEVYYKKSTDGGATWMASQRLTWNSGLSYWADIAVDSSGHLHVVWADRTPGSWNIFYKKSTDGGATWTASTRLTWDPVGGLGPVIAADSSGHLYLVWYGYTAGNDEIYYKRSTDGGATWTASRRLTWMSGRSHIPTLAVDLSDGLHIVWQDDTPSDLYPEIYYKKSADAGATWTASQRLTWTSGGSNRPVIAVGSSGNLHLVWEDNTAGNDEIYYKKSTDAGATWTPSQRLTWTLGRSFRPTVAIGSSGGLHLVWQDDTPSEPFPEIYYKQSADEEAAWTANQRLTWTSAYSWDPAISVDALGNLHVFWDDNAPGNFEIYYKKFIK